MQDTFEQFVTKYTESFHNNRLNNDLIDSLKKQYEMDKSERKAVKNLCKKYDVGNNDIIRKQLMPNDFGNIICRDDKMIKVDDFVFNMNINNSIYKTIPERHIYVVEGICTARITGITIMNISFFSGDTHISSIPGYQIKETYYFESPVYIQEEDTLKINVTMSDMCTNFPIMFLGYKFYVDKK